MTQRKDLACGTINLWRSLTVLCFIFFVVGFGIFAGALADDPGVSGIPTCDINEDCFSDNIPFIGSMGGCEGGFNSQCAYPLSKESANTCRPGYTTCSTGCKSIALFEGADVKHKCKWECKDKDNLNSVVFWENCCDTQRDCGEYVGRLTISVVLIFFSSVLGVIFSCGICKCCCFGRTVTDQFGNSHAVPVTVSALPTQLQYSVVAAGSPAYPVVAAVSLPTGGVVNQQATAIPVVSGKVV